MTEVIRPPVQAAETVYYDFIGNPLTQDEYIDYETQEANRYLEGPTEDKEFARRPGSILALIAAQGSPSLSDFRIRFQTWYVHMDDTVLDNVLQDYQRAGFLVTHIAEDAPTLSSGKKDINYSLTHQAYELIPALDAIVKKRSHLQS